MKSFCYILLVYVILMRMTSCQDNSTTLPVKQSTNSTTTSIPVVADIAKPVNASTELQIPTFVANYPQKEGSFGWLVNPAKCKNSCSGNGECHGVYSQFINQKKQTKDTVIIYVCMCNENFIGDSCGGCVKGFYGPKCEPCITNPADGYICGAYGICDDGIQGTGQCMCSSPELEPSLFCESASREFIHEEEENFTAVFFAVLCILFLSLLVLYLYSKIEFLERFPESIIGLIFGAIIGICLRFSHFYNEYLKDMKFDTHAYFLFLLPPIMFQVGFSMNASTFFRNIGTINAYAIGGTLLASALYGTVVYFGIYYTTSIPYSFMECLQLGCIVSAIDPVATMSIFKSLKVNEKIYMYIFGESTLNNSVVIAICAAIEGIKRKM